MILADDRTPEQRDALCWLVIGTDPFLSGWGKAQGGPSYAAWACDDSALRDCLAWVEDRGDVKRVRTVIDRPGDRYRPPSGPGHCHIYVWER